MTQKVFTGPVEHVVDGNVFRINVTNVKSVACIEPICDEVFPTSKADLRQGLCADCYKNEEAKEKKMFRQRYAVITYSLFGLMFSVAIFVLSVFVAEIMTEKKMDFPYPWVLVGVMALFICWVIFFGVSYEKIERKYYLPRPQYRGQEE